MSLKLSTLIALAERALGADLQQSTIRNIKYGIFYSKSRVAIDVLRTFLYNKLENDGGVPMKEALLNLLTKMDGHDVVATFAITAAVGLGALGLTYACGYEISFEKRQVSIQKVNRPCIEA